MKLEEGKRYVRRDGEISGVLEKNTGMSKCNFPFYDPAHEFSYNEKGWFFGGHSDVDLISEYSEYVEPKQNPYPKVMMVSEHGGIWLKRVVFMEKNGKFIAWNQAKTLEQSESSYHTTPWPCAKDIEETKLIPELTIEELQAKLGYEFKIVKKN